MLLWLYRGVQATGLLSTGWGRSAFEWAYDWYKALLEAGDIRALEGLVSSGAWLVDVGANIGFFTVRFAAWVNSGGRVVAIEPESYNFERLTHRLRQRGFSERVDAIQAVAAESEGMLRLAINPHHPADHRIATEGVAVRAVALDQVLAGHGWPRVALIKIDVQGAEHRVLSGARETLQRLRPRLLIEVDDGALRALGSSADAVLSLLSEAGYEPHRLERGGISAPISREEVLAKSQQGRYTDFLFQPRPSARQPAGGSA
jgi:FkbM family methyltransferase